MDIEMRWIHVNTAAKKLGISRQRCYVLISRGQLTGVAVDGHWMVSVRSIQERERYCRAQDRSADVSR